LRHGRVNDGLHFGGIFDITAQCQRFHSEALQFGGSLLATLLLPCAQHEIGAHFRQAFRHLAAKADGTAGDDGNASSEIKELSNIHRRWRAFQYYLTFCGDSSVAYRKRINSRIGKY
jgi:hypothetical protein